MNEPEGFEKDKIEAQKYREQIISCTPIYSKDQEPMDDKNVIKAISLGIGLSFVAVSFLIKFITFWDKISIRWPKLSFENNLLVIGLFILIPYIAISIYDRLKKEEVKEDKEKDKK